MKQSLLLLLFASLFLFSCGDDVDCDPNSFANDVNAEITEVNATGTAYAQDPTEENCEEFKKAAEAYLDAVEKYENCGEIDSATYQQQLQSARNALAQVPCN